MNTNRGLYKGRRIDNNAWVRGWLTTVDGKMIINAVNSFDFSGWELSGVEVYEYEVIPDTVEKVSLPTTCRKCKARNDCDVWMHNNVKNCLEFKPITNINNIRGMNPAELEDFFSPCLYRRLARWSKR